MNFYMKHHQGLTYNTNIQRPTMCKVRDRSSEESPHHMANSKMLLIWKQSLETPLNVSNAVSFSKSFYKI